MIWREKGPRALKHRAAEDDVGRASAVDSGAKISSVGKLRVRFRTPPPPPLKGRKARGVRNGLHRR
jgi:hypothetical protein